MSDRKTRDELGQTEEAITQVVQRLQKAVEFSRQIGAGNYQVQLDHAESDVLMEELVNMRNKLKATATSEAGRLWVSEGLKAFNELVRVQHHQSESAWHSSLAALTKYAGANQSALFLLNPERELHAVAAFAWDRHKRLDRSFATGEGLVGQCWLERETLFITDLPDEYTLIRSGLGAAPPRSLVLIPLINNDECFGVLEVAFLAHVPADAVPYLEECARLMALQQTSQTTEQRTQNLLEEATRLRAKSEEKEAQLREQVQELEQFQLRQEAEIMELRRELTEAKRIQSWQRRTAGSKEAPLFNLS
ncbi:MAG: GAF domain-containing protein [Cytophagales bacterium]|nr:GAF domain-containing protein [Cytophagales bacterium]